MGIADVLNRLLGRGSRAQREARDTEQLSDDARTRAAFREGLEADRQSQQAKAKDAKRQGP